MYISPKVTILGTCSLCGGAVIVREFLSQVKDVPQCRDCGARKKQPYGPVIEMERPLREAEPTRKEEDSDSRQQTLFQFVDSVPSMS